MKARRRSAGQQESAPIFEMDQLRRVSTVVAIISAVIALGSGTVLFFLFEPPFLASIFLASAAIAIACFASAAVGAYFGD